MKTKSRILSLFLAILMFASVFAAIPPIEAWAADGDAPSVVWVNPTVGDDYVTLKGKITANGGVKIDSYGFGYIINNSSADYNWAGLTHGTISNNKTFSYTINGLKPGDRIDYVIVAKNQYGEDKTYETVTIPHEFDISEEELNFDADGGSDTFKITTTLSYTITKSNPWISVSSTSGTGNKTITVTCTKNTSISPRSGYVNVKNNTTGETFTIDVNQEGSIPDIDVSEDYLEFDADGGTDTFKVFAEDAYTISESLSWISLSATSGSSDKTITVTCKENTSTSSRDGTITVMHTSTGDKYTIDVYQEGAESKEDPEVTDLSVPKTTVTVGEEFIITIKTNLDADGVVLYVKDTNGEIHRIGDVKTASSTTSTTKTFKYEYFFNKTNKTDSTGADVSNTRKLYAYPINSDGEEVLDDSVCDYVNMTVNPAEATFSDFEVKTPVKAALGNSAVVSWGKAVSTIGSTPTYKVYIDNEYYGSTTATSYTLPASYITGLGVGDHSITIQATAEGHRAKQSSNHGALLIEEPEKDPEVTDLSVPKTTVTVGEEFIITIKTNLDADGVVLYVKDTNGETYRLGDVKTASSTTSTTKTFKYEYFFNKTNKTDSTGADVSNTRKLYAYPIDSDGKEVLDDSVCDYVNMTVNPAEATFSDFEVKTPVKVTLGNSAVVSWGKAVSTIGSTPTYKVYIDNEYYGSTTATSYTLPASYITELGVGDHSITIQATSAGHRAKQSLNHGALIIEGAPVPSTRGDLNGDGQVTNKDRFILNRYLNGIGYADIDKTLADINGDGNVNQADAEYLTRHLDGWPGYETLPTPKPTPTPTPTPTPNPSPECAHETCTRAYVGIVWVNNIIKNGKTHQYKKEYNLICNTCQKTVGKDTDKVVSEAHSYDSDGVCVCGSIDTTGYTAWDAENITGKTVRVYGTPYSGDGSYGAIYDKEVVRVIGFKAGRYLIEYSTSWGKKQGYIDPNAIIPKTNFWIAFDFETAILPVSGREVLLIPKDGSAHFYLYNGKTPITDPDMLENLHIEFVGGGDCWVKKSGTTIVGKKEGGSGGEGGVGSLSVYYVVNGERYYLECPSLYIVAESQAVYASTQKNKFSQTESEYITLALDMHYSQNKIKVPYELYWSGGENFLLCVEEFDNILAALFKDGSATENDYATVLAEFIKKYVKVEESPEDDTVSAEDTWLNDFFDALKMIKTTADAGKDLIEKIDDVNNILKLTKIKSGDMLQLFKNILSILTDETFKELVQNSPNISKMFLRNGLTINDCVYKINSMIGDKNFWTKFDNALLGIDIVVMGVKAVSTVCVTIFGNWSRHRELLIMMEDAIITIPETERSENYKLLLKAIRLLIDRYDADFFDRMHAGFQQAAADLVVAGGKLALGIVLQTVCPVAAGAYALLNVVQGFTELSNSREEADMIRIRQFYMLLNQAIWGEFKDLYENGKTFSSVYGNVKTVTRMYLNMAIYTNEMAQGVTEYTASDKVIYTNNVNRIKDNFRAYLY